MTKKLIIYIFLVLLIAAVSLSPRFSLGVLFPGRNIDIRAEDVLILIGLIAWIFYILIKGKYKFKLPPLFWPIFCLLGWGFFSILINLLFGNILLGEAFFYFLKEVEFFVLYFFIFSLISVFNLNKQMPKWWFGFALINVLWLAYVSIFNIRWSIVYGPEAFAEPRGPFPSGGFFLLLFIFLFNLYLFYYSKLYISKTKKFFILMLSIAPIVGVVSSGSRASVVGLVFSLFISFILILMGKINFVSFVKIAALCVFFIFVFSQILYFVPSVTRVVYLRGMLQEYAFNEPGSRMVILNNHLSELLSSPKNLIIGLGISGEAHSQYIRIVLERGIVGLFLFFWLMWSILKISYREFREKDNLFKSGLCAGLFVATIAMLAISIPNDAFMTVKPNEVYWFFAAMAMSEIFAQGKNVKIVD